MSLTKHNIEQLIELCKSGNQFAQLEVYNRYYKAMYNTALRIVKDSFEAEDIMQEAFLNAFTKLDSLKETKTFGSWLKRIVINNSIYHYNKSDKYDQVPIDDVMYKMEDHSGITEDQADTSYQVKQVIESISGLKDNYRIALTLHLIEGYDYEEMSEIMNLSYANCRTTVSRAKDKLRRNLQHLAEY
ncbi:MAG: RNA polymerase sigma factor [Flavobacteriaceae bacterium]|nr:RNA polymerase sigma factor [Flavobacteriaceae bacterium]